MRNNRTELFTSILFVLLVITAVLFVSRPVHAQSVATVSNAVFERIYAETASCDDVSIVLNQDLSGFDALYCGVIGDTFTSVNKDWTHEKLLSFGYRQASAWQSHVSALGYVVWISGYIKSGSPNIVVGLSAITDRDFTAFVLAYTY